MTPTLLSGLAMAAVLLFAAAVATRPWWRQRGVQRQDRRAANVAAYRLRLAEIEAETASGLIPPEEAAALRAELDARLLTDADGTRAEPDAAIGRRPLLVGIVTVLLGGFAFAWYGTGQSWQVYRQIALAPPPAPAAAPLAPEIVAMVATLAQRLKDKPDDPEAWAMLGRSYVVMQRYGDAAQAYGEANRRAAQPNAAWLADEGEALAFANGQNISGRAAELFEASLKLAPDAGKSLWYAGLGAAAAGDYPTARARWQRLLDTGALADEMQGAVAERIRTLDEAIAAGGGVVPAAPRATAPVTPPATASAPPTGPAQGGALATAAATSIRVRVSLAPALAQKIPANATLFVFAKAQSGPPMPLAVQRLPAPTLPMEITLDDGQAMVAGMNLSRFDRYTITARLSASGGAQAQAGDLEGRLETERPASGSAAVDLVIDRLLP